MPISSHSKFLEPPLLLFGTDFVNRMHSQIFYYAARVARHLWSNFPERSPCGDPRTSSQPSADLVLRYLKVILVRTVGEFCASGRLCPCYSGVAMSSRVGSNEGTSRHVEVFIPPYDSSCPCCKKEFGAHQLFCPHNFQSTFV